ncbi:putative toxin-antitoxin system, toxin component [Trichinella spiralis]|uniref:putative toxin-antitoxin system, toxin component n=1 Tax=Trichinella spiralis TaxID=6334 RepID=UPI0001EFC74D|nr:putative toxin-antitoxin system, toxin component [Trichinella spiralis]
MKEYAQLFHWQLVKQQSLCIDKTNSSSQQHNCNLLDLTSLNMQECAIEHYNLQWNTNKRTFPLPINMK